MTLGFQIQSTKPFNKQQIIHFFWASVDSDW